jgi:acyl carrier protein
MMPLQEPFPLCWQSSLNVQIRRNKKEQEDREMQTLLEILDDIRPDLDFTSEKNLMGDKLLTSFDILAIVSEISETYGIRLSAGEIRPENFNSVQAMWDMITRLKH